MSIIKPAILAVDDESDLLLTYQAILNKKYKVLTANSGKQALQILGKEAITLVLLDLKMPGMDGLETLKKIKNNDQDIEVIMITASKDALHAIEAMKLGALDYVIKPFEVKELLVLISKAFEKIELKQENRYLKETLKSQDAFCDIIGRTAIMKKLFSQIEKIANTDTRVLIFGESGSGKELVARAIHKKSPKAHQPFVAINCAAIPDTLFESELFGHERGSFTGAMERRIGKFELANNGTLFLDEIGCMPMGMQAKLLRVLEHPFITRLGGEKEIEINVRIVSATNIDFERHIKEGKFREDLYYRLNVIPLKIPALRDRAQDITLLVDHFLDKFNKKMNRKVKGFKKPALKILQEYHWPGNIRELQNSIERIVALAENPMVEPDDLDFSYKTPSAVDPIEPQLMPTNDLNQCLEAFEKEHILQALNTSDGNISRAARGLNLARSTLALKMKTLNIISSATNGEI